MIFDNADANVPAGITADDFTIRPLSVTDVEPDYAAVMESKLFLRAWEQTGWPADDFTIDGNYADLDRHEQEHLRRESFTFTVFDADDVECLGCIYLFNTSSKVFRHDQIVPVAGHQWTDYEAVISFWIRSSRLAEGIDARLLDVIEPWFRDDWGFDGHLWSTSEGVPQQVELLEGRGHELQFTLTDTRGGRAPSRVYAAPAMR